MAYIDKYGVEFSDDRKTLIRCPDFQREYVIPDSVTTIGDSAFRHCYLLTSVIIPNSVTSIGERAFYQCYVLSKITIPPSVTCIGKEAFVECRSLTSFEIPNSIKNIEQGVFVLCEKLSYIKIPNSVTCIGKGAFSYCRNLTSIEIPDSITSIEKHVFWGCDRLTSVVIPDGVRNIGYFAFGGCFSLASAIIPNSVISIGERAFSSKNLKEISVPLGQEERFCQMDGLKEFAEIIRKTSEKRRAQIRQQEREAREQQQLQAQQLQEMLQDSILFFDTETTGVPRNYKAPVSDSANWPRLVQLAWLMADKDGNILKRKSVIIKPDGFSIPSDASAVHGITTERAQREGQLLGVVMDEFMNDVQLAASVVGHNIDFDMHIVGAELYRLDKNYDLLMDKPCTCTMKSSTDFCAIPNPNPYFGGYKWPSLQELYRKLFNRDFADAHDALADITATKECFLELRKRRVI